VKKKILIVLIIILGMVVLFALAGMAIQAKIKQAANKETEVRLESPQRGALVEFITAPGVVEPKRNVEISAKISARVVEIPVQEGDTVTKGNASAPPTVLIRLDSTDLVALLRSAKARRQAQAARIEVSRAEITGKRANIEACKARLDQLRRKLEREKTLLTSRDVSQSTVDETQSLFDEQQAQLTIAENNLKTSEMNLLVMEYELDAADADISRAQQDLTYTTITSPMDGIVTKINAEVGEVVMTGTMNNPGTVIMEIGDLSEMLVVAQVDQMDIAKVKVGQKAKVEFQAWADRIFEGVVEKTALAQTNSMSAKYFEVEVLLKNADGREVLSGLSGDVDIETATYTDVLKIPSQAVLSREVDELPVDIRENPLVDIKKTSASVVYRFKDGKAVVTPVKIGESDTSHTIIKEGITEQDKIITGPFKILKTLKHDQNVKDEKEKKKVDPGTPKAALSGDEGEKK